MTLKEVSRLDWTKVLAIIVANACTIIFFGATLRADVDHLQTDMKEMKADMKELSATQTSVAILAAQVQELRLQVKAFEDSRTNRRNGTTN